MNKKKAVICFLVPLLCLSFSLTLSPDRVLREITKADINSSRYIIINKIILLYYTVLPERTIASIANYNEKNNSENILFLLGSIGDADCENYLLKKTNELQGNQTRYPSNFLSLINSLAVIKSEKVKKKLVHLLETNNSKKWDTLEMYYFSNWTIARALYLQTGRLYSYHGRSGKNVTIPVTYGLEAMRKTINGSYNQRNFSQIVEVLEFVLPTKKSPDFDRIIRM